MRKKCADIGFAAISESLTPSGEGYSAYVPNEWTQGRSIFGGMVAGLAYEAAIRRFSDLPPLRSMQLSFVGPINFGKAGRSNYVPSLLRQGKNVTFINVDVTSELGLGARANFVFGAARESRLSQASMIEPLTDPLSYPRFTPRLAEPFVPKFFLQFETRLIAGHRPMAGADEGYMLTAIRHKDAASRGIAEGETGHEAGHEAGRGTDMGAFLTLADALPPSGLSRLKKLTPVGTMSWMLNILDDDISTEDGWWRLDAVMRSAQNGYMTETAGLWNASGRKIAEAMQSVAVFA